MKKTAHNLDQDQYHVASYGTDDLSTSYVRQQWRARFFLLYSMTSRYCLCIYYLQAKNKFNALCMAGRNVLIIYRLSYQVSDNYIIHQVIGSRLLLIHSQFLRK